jgi:hypothetical protein
VTGTSARSRPDAMNEKFRKVDTHLHGMYYGATCKKLKETHVQMLQICTNYFVGMFKWSVYGHNMKLEMHFLRENIIWSGNLI